MLSAKLFLLFGCAAIITMTSAADTLVGAPTNLSDVDLKEAQDTLQNSLTKLATGDGPSYKISKVNSASRQVVAGTKYTFDVDLIDGNEAVKRCNVIIWSRPWLENGIEVTFDCPDQEKIVRKHSA